VPANGAIEVFGDDSKPHVLDAAGNQRPWISSQAELLMGAIEQNLCFSFRVENEFHGRHSLVPLHPPPVLGGGEFISDLPTSDLSLFQASGGGEFLE